MTIAKYFKEKSASLVINGNWHWLWVPKTKQETVCALTNLETNMLYLKEPANKEAICGMKERNK